MNEYIMFGLREADALASNLHLDIARTERLHHYGSFFSDALDQMIVDAEDIVAALRKVKVAVNGEDEPIFHHPV